MTPSDLSTLEVLANAATPGPWSAVDEDIQASGRPVGQTYQDRMGHADAAFIVAACNALPQLISEFRRLRDECDRLNNLALDHREALTGYEIHHAEEREAVRRLILIASDAVSSLIEAGYHATAAKLRDQLRIVRGE